MPKQRRSPEGAEKDSPKGKKEPNIQEKIRVDGEIKHRENKYYQRLAENYKTAGFLLFLVFVVFCGVMMLRYNEYITYDNFVYLVRDFDSVNGKDSESAVEIDLDVDDSSVVKQFREGFAVASMDNFN